MERKIPYRVVIAIQLFFATFVLYLVRVNMSINILAMVTETGKEPASDDEGDHNSTTTKVPLPNYGPRYDWSRAEQGLVLSAYFYGYVIGSLPGGYLSERFGGMIVILISTVLSGVLTILTAFAASIHFSLVFVVRLLIGLVGGLHYPAYHSLIAHWAPPQEKSKFVAALSGNAIGTVVTWPMLGQIIPAMGWIWAFIIPGIICTAWCATWWLLVADSPAKHRLVPQKEKAYLLDNVLVTVGHDSKKTPPYKQMFLNVPFWALMVTHFGDMWGLFLLLTTFPMYMSEALGFNIKESGALSTLPYIARFVGGLLFGVIADFILEKQWMSTTAIRKVFVIFSHIVPGVLLYMLMFVSTAAPAISLISVSLGFNGASVVTNLQNPQDLAPNYAGTIFGTVNAVAGVTGIITPIITTAITRERSGIPEWRIVYAIGASVYMFCGICFFVFGSGKTQEFNKSKAAPAQTTAAT